MRRTPALVLLLLVPVVVIATAGPAFACGGLVGPAGTVQLERTSTLAAHADGVEHYVTSFEFTGGGAEVGSIVPLPAVPTKVEKGGAWTLQRLQQEVAISSPEALTSVADQVAARAPAEELLNTRIDALDITVLRGGGAAVGTWAREHGFSLTPDAPAILDFYAERSPIFMAARFDATAAQDRGQGVGDGTPIHVTMPLDEPWVPLRILSLGLTPDEPVEADLFLLTEEEPDLLAGGPGLSLERSEPASELLLSDLRSDEGMGWVPEKMWLSHLDLSARAEQVDYDLAMAPAGDVGAPPDDIVAVELHERIDWAPVGLVLLGLVAITAASVLGLRLGSRGR
jgi:hypothetical protein